MNRFFAILVLFLLSFHALGQDSVQSDPEFKEMLETLNHRYEDFFIHEAEGNRWQQQMKVGSGEIKAERRQLMQEAERARLEFIRDRTAEPSKTPLFRLWQAEKRTDAQIYEQSRREYLLRRNALRKIESSVRKIPEEQEYRLYIEEE